MPSWNVHIAHANRLLADAGARSLGVSDVDAFLFGNVLPDVYVGYMVPHPTKILGYCRTHQSYPGGIPLPNYKRYWRNFIASYDFERRMGGVTDLMLGVWCHIVCDHTYNKYTRRYIHAHDIPVGEKTRIRKQTDFDLYGRSLTMGRLPRLTSELVQQGAAYPQYCVREADICAALEVIDEIAQTNLAAHEESPHYNMLNKKFFSTAAAEAHWVMLRGLTGRHEIVTT